MDKLNLILETMSNTDNGSNGQRLSAEDYERRLAQRKNEEAGRLNEEDGYDCTICRNKGRVYDVREVYGYWEVYGRDCVCRTVRSSISRLKRSGLEHTIENYTFDKYSTEQPWQEDIKKQAMDYADNPRGWFFVGGQTGSGKTHICTAICRELLLQGLEVRYLMWRDELPRLKAAMNTRDYESIIGGYKQTAVLYIDDLFKIGAGADGGARPTAADISLAYELLNFRYNNPRLSTIISSEYTLPELIRIDEAVAGRIAERAATINVRQDITRNYRLNSAKRTMTDTTRQEGALNEQ